MRLLCTKFNVDRPYTFEKKSDMIHMIFLASVILNSCGEQWSDPLYITCVSMLCATGEVEMYIHGATFSVSDANFPEH